MAFATTQSIDQLLTRGLAFRLPNNAPISSLYTLYANGAGMTYWSNSINPRDLSTLSTSIGELASTVTFQGSQISTTDARLNSLSTGVSSLSNFLLGYINSSITGISTFSTFWTALGQLSNTVQANNSTLSSAINVTNASTIAYLSTSIQTVTNNVALSSATGIWIYTNRISSAFTYNNNFLSSSAGLNRTILSTSTGLQNTLSTLSTGVGLRIGDVNTAYISTTTNQCSTITGYAPRISSLEGASTNMSTTAGVWISSQVGASQAIQDTYLQGRLNSISTYLSTVASGAFALVSTQSTTTGLIYQNISTINGVNVSQDAAISSLSRNLSILTTSSILAGVYDTFVQLEFYTVELINSTVFAMNYWMSTLYSSTILQTQGIANAYFSTFTNTAYQSTVSATTALAIAYTSTYASQLNSTSIAQITAGNSTLLSALYSTTYTNVVAVNSTQAAILYSTSLDYVISTVGVVPQPLRSTVVFIGSNAGSTLQRAFAIGVGFNAGQSNQNSNAVAIGNAAGRFAQGQSAVAIGNNAGISNMGSNAVGIGLGAGSNAQGIAAVAIGWNAGLTGQGVDAVAVGDSAGCNTQGANAVALGRFTGRANQGANAIAIGNTAGSNAQGANAIAVGFGAGQNAQVANSIILNASNVALNAATNAGLYINPVRSNAAITGNFVHYDTVTREIVFNDVGGSGGGGVGFASSFYTSTVFASSIVTETAYVERLYANSTFFKNLGVDNEIVSTSRGIAISAQNVYGVETARTVDYNSPVGATELVLVSTIGGGINGLGRWTSHGQIAMSAEGKYIYTGSGNNNTAPLGYLWRSDDYGQTFNQLESFGSSNYNGFACSRSGEIVYVAVGGDGISSGKPMISTDYGRTYTNLNSFPSAVWANVACSGDGRILIALVPNLLDYVYISYDYGKTVTTLGNVAVYNWAAISLTGQYMAIMRVSLFLGAPPGLMISEDYGQTWREAPSPIDVVSGNVCMSANGKFMVVGSGDTAYYYSSDYGRTWASSSVSGLIGSMYPISIYCDDSGQYVVAGNCCTATAGFIYSSDYGRTFTTLLNATVTVACCISRNAQLMIWLPRPSIYRSAVRTYFPTGLVTTGTTVSTLAYFVNSNLSGPAVTGSANTWNSVLALGSVSNTNGSNRSWDIGIETTDSSGRSLGFFSYDTPNFTGTRTINGYIDPGAVNVQMNFTGQHRCFPADDSLFPLTSNIGKVVIATGQYQSMPLNGALVRGISSITIAESLPLISLSRRSMDKQCFGVICDVEDFASRQSENGNFVTPYSKVPGDTRIFVNSLGEGAIWVIEANGAIENGDYLTSSDVPGYAMKQGDPYIANYTVAKATMSCDFQPHLFPRMVPMTTTVDGKTTYVLDAYSTIMWMPSSTLEPTFQTRFVNAAGETIGRGEYEVLQAAGEVVYRAAFLGCTYHCG